MENGEIQIYYGQDTTRYVATVGSAICAACEGKQAAAIQSLKG